MTKRSLISLALLSIVSNGAQAQTLWSSNSLSYLKNLSDF